MLGLRVPAWQRWARAREAAVHARAARDRWLEHRLPAVAHHFVERAPQTRRARAAVVALLAHVIPARERLAAEQVACVPACVIDDTTCVDFSGGGPFLPLALTDGGERCEWATDAIALVSAACTEGATSLVAKDLV